MIEPLLKAQLDPVVRRTRNLRLWQSLGWYWLFAALGAAAVLAITKLLGLPVWIAIAGSIAAAALGSSCIRSRARKWNLDYQQIARQIEQQHPELHALLMTAVEQQPDPATGKLNYFQERVIQQAIDESRRNQWVDSVSDRELSRAETLYLGALCGFILALVIIPTVIPQKHRSFSLPSFSRVEVSPGDVTLERGSALVILARFDGKLPATATMVMQSVDQDPSQLALQKNLDDPVFGGSIPEVQRDFVYHIEYDGQHTRDYKVNVFELPRLERADAKVVFPDYTSLPEKEIPDTRRVSAVEGSHVGLKLQLNKPVISAQLVGKDKSTLPLQVRGDAPVAALNDFALQASQSYELQLRDADGRTNRIPAQFVFEALKNRPPELKFAAPRGDQRVSPLEEMQFEAEAWDDYGIRNLGLDFSIPGRERQTIPLSVTTVAKDKQKVSHLLRLEDLGVGPEQLVSYYLWAEDVGPDGKVRRTSSDMFFAEVRPFEEIYREDESGGAAGGGQQSGSGNEALKLAELQKQIINATWKLQRQEQGNSVSPQYKKDIPVVQESQEKARQKVEQLKMRATDPRGQVLLQNVEEEMEKALTELKRASDSIEPLVPAVKAEQSAYQSLLRMASREHMVSRQRRQQSGSQGGAQANRQQQLDQLELKQEENRYETQRQARRRQTPEQQEQLGVLNRLKELAQRQQDLNERIKELQLALQEAKTDAEKEELRRRLKRLREEEREMLADMDELKQRMEKPENQSRMAESREQLEKTRHDVQRASEALDQSNSSQALAAGARAQKELEQMREDFRKKNSNGFSEAMREMRNEARQLAQQQAEVGQKLQETTDTRRKTLGGSPEGKDLAEKFDAQKSALTNLLDHMRSVSEQAENSEPLLSKELYDSFRKASQANVENSLNTSQELLKRSFVSEARQFEQKARKEIDELKRGVERAAESVLGNEAEGLKAAKEELERLSQQLQQEIARAESQSGQTNGGAGAVARGGENEQSTNRVASLSGSQGSNQTARAEGQQSRQNSGARSEQGERSAQAAQNGGQQSQGQQSSDSQRGQQSGQNGQTAQNGQNSRNAQNGRDGQNARDGQDGQNGERSADAQRGNNRPGRNNRANFFDQAMDQAGGDGGGRGGPMTGEDYRDWAERLGNVEEMLENPQMRTEVTRIRDRARNFRSEFKRHAKDPQWDLVRLQVLAPLNELRDQVNQELLRHESSEALVPIDRDPVPSKFSELVKRYYEKLGKSE